MISVKHANCINKIKKIENSIPKPMTLVWPRKAEDGTPIGIDVEVKRPDIIKIVHRYFKVSSISMEELLQEVFLAIAHKNHGKSAHDPRKSSFGHYIYMVSNNVCINLVNRKKRFDNEKDSLDTPNGNENCKTVMETAKVIEIQSDPFYDKMEEIETIMRKRGMWKEARYIRAARSGAPSDIIREALSWEGNKVTCKDMRDIRHRLREIINTNLIF
ncbi:MAG TPA: hypothetical protein ENI61_07275 [Ignavibacteria bacterium]|nr:hypothetical protein [Ignavibacteria bacterium]